MSERFFVLGKGIDHSCSPAMHNALFQRMGLPWRYGKRDVAEVEEARSLISSREYAGMNVTMPYKPLALEMADKASPSARMAGGANVLSLEDGVLHAYNVDGIGAVDWLRMRGVCFEGASVVVCGTGPTSMAILHACAAAGANKATLVGRSAARACDALERYRGELEGASCENEPFPQGLFENRGLREVFETVEFESGDYASASEAIVQADVILDATPLGMQPGDPAPFDTSLLRSDQVVFDVVYGHGKTALAKACEDAGCRFVDGEGMLAAQAVAGELIWLERQNIPTSLPPHEMFALMANAAGFQC